MAYIRFDESIDVDSLAHFGVKGMHWGVWNEETRQRRLGLHREKTASLDKVDNRIKSEKSSKNSSSRSTGSQSENVVNEKHHLTDKQKTALKIAAGVAIVAAVGGASYLAYKKGYLPIGKNATKHAMDKLAKEPIGLLPSAEEAFGRNLPKVPPGMSMDQHLKAVNPLHGAWGHGDNCTSCTTALEMRLRGFDVEAVPMTKGQSVYDIAGAFKDADVMSPIAYALGDDVAKSIFSEKSSGKRLAKTYWEALKDPSCISKMNNYPIFANRILDDMPDGARGNLCGTYRGTMAGHSIFWEKTGGNLIFRDGQTGETYKDYNAAIGVFDRNFSFFRTDNLEVNWDVMSKNVRAHNSYYDNLPFNRKMSANEHDFIPEVREKFQNAKRV